MSLLNLSEENSSMDLKDSSTFGSGTLDGNYSASSWIRIRSEVRSSRKIQAQLANKIPHNFSFLPLTNSDPSFTESSGSRLLFLGVLPGYRENTLLYIDIPSTHSPGLLDKPVEWKQAMHSFQGTTVKYSKEEELLRERKRLSVHGITNYQISSDNSRVLFPTAGSLYVMDIKNIGMVDMEGPKKVYTTCSGSRMDPEISPNNCDLVSFIHDNDLWVTHIESCAEERLTYTSKGNKSIENPFSAGTPSYVVQEEFDRYTGYWWQPNTPPGKHCILYELVDESAVEVMHISNPLSQPDLDSFRYPKAGTPNAKVSLRLVEFSVTEEGQLLALFMSRTILVVDVPKGAEQLASLALQLSQFADSRKIRGSNVWPATFSFAIVDVVSRKMSDPLSQLFPWMEYIVRVDWLPNGSGIWAQLLDRLQLRTSIVFIPVSQFDQVVWGAPSTDPIMKSNGADVEMSQDEDTTAATQLASFNSIQNSVKVLHEESSTVWINVHDTFYFFHNNPDDEVHFIWASEQTGHRHLYLIKSNLKRFNRSKRHSTGDLVAGESRFCLTTCTTLTEGDWEVMEQTESIWVDEKNEDVFFMALKDSPLESHLYKTSYSNPGNPLRLTHAGRSHSVAMSQNCDQFVTVSSSINELYMAKVYSVTPRLFPLVNVLEPSATAKDYSTPELFSFQSSSGDTLHGLYITPTEMEPGRKYPTVLFVYGGPHVQLVSNSFKGLRYQRLYTLASFGYVVIAIDGHGSTHRGLSFEGHLKHRMGQIEINDQVEGLLYLANKVPFIDISRVAIHGWSYGGYLSLMGIAQRPDVFKVAVAGAPVVCWEQYDTAYTERYMGTPQSNPDAYRDGSVLSHVPKFPNEPNRLLVVHGLIDENVHFVHTAHLVEALVKNCKPYQLQIYPGERHGIRSPDSNKHFEVAVVSFLKQNL